MRRIFIEKIKNLLKKFFLIDDTPHKVAGGAALGIFLGIVPGEGVLTTLVLSSLFRLNRLAALAGVGISNMWTTIFVLPLAAFFGGWIFGIDSKALLGDFDRTYHLGLKYFLSKTIFFDLALPLITGFVLVAGMVALAAYFGILFFLIQRKHLKKDEHVLINKK
jgi:uncharacterized protein (DUF2062 family)